MTDIEVYSIQKETCSQHFNPLYIVISIFSIIIYFKINKKFNDMQNSINDMQNQIYSNKSDFKNNKMLIKELMNTVEIIENFIDKRFLIKNVDDFNKYKNLFDPENTIEKIKESYKEISDSDLLNYYFQYDDINNVASVIAGVNRELLVNNVTTELIDFNTKKSIGFGSFKKFSTDRQSGKLFFDKKNLNKLILQTDGGGYNDCNGADPNSMINHWTYPHSIKYFCKKIEYNKFRVGYTDNQLNTFMDKEETTFKIPKTTIKYTNDTKTFYNIMDIEF